jgi:hypothetical protein
MMQPAEDEWSEGSRRRCVHPYTGIAFLVFSYSLIITDVFPRFGWIDFYTPDDVYVHGWPMLYMSRQLAAVPDMGHVYFGPWPFGHWYGSFGNPPLIKFNAGSLIVDILVAVVLLWVSVKSVHKMCAAWEIRPRFTFRQMLILMTVACVGFGGIGGVASHAGVLVSTLFYAFFAVLFLTWLPKCLVLLSLALAVLRLAAGIRSRSPIRGNAT